MIFEMQFDSVIGKELRQIDNDQSRGLYSLQFTKHLLKMFHNCFSCHKFTKVGPDMLLLHSLLLAKEIRYCYGLCG